MKLNLIQRLDLISHCGVVTNSKNTDYFYYLKFGIKVRFNDLLYEKKYTKRQLYLIRLIQSLRKEGYGYTRIANYLNERNILSTRKTRFNNAKVHRVLKRFQQKKEQIEKIRNKKYEMKWVSKMRLVYE